MKVDLLISFFKTQLSETIAYMLCTEWKRRGCFFEKVYKFQIMKFETITYTNSTITFWFCINIFILILCSILILICKVIQSTEKTNVFFWNVFLWKTHLLGRSILIKSFLYRVVRVVVKIKFHLIKFDCMQKIAVITKTILRIQKKLILQTQVTR